MWVVLQKRAENLPEKGETSIMNPSLANRGEQVLLLQGMKPLLKYDLRKLEDGKISVFGVALG